MQALADQVAAGQVPGQPSSDAPAPRRVQRKPAQPPTPSTSTQPQSSTAKRPAKPQAELTEASFVTQSEAVLAELKQAVQDFGSIKAKRLRVQGAQSMKQLSNKLYKLVNRLS